MLFAIRVAIDTEAAGWTYSIHKRVQGESLGLAETPEYSLPGELNFECDALSRVSRAHKCLDVWAVPSCHSLDRVGFYFFWASLQDLTKARSPVVLSEDLGILVAEW